MCLKRTLRSSSVFVMFCRIYISRLALLCQTFLVLLSSYLLYYCGSYFVKWKVQVSFVLDKLMWLRLTITKSIRLWNCSSNKSRKLGEFKLVAYLFVLKTIKDFFLENLQLILHLRVDVPLGVQDDPSEHCVANFVSGRCEN